MENTEIFKKIYKTRRQTSDWTLVCFRNEKTNIKIHSQIFHFCQKIDLFKRINVIHDELGHIALFLIRRQRKIVTFQRGPSLGRHFRSDHQKIVGENTQPNKQICFLARFLNCQGISTEARWWQRHKLGFYRSNVIIENPETSTLILI